MNAIDAARFGPGSARASRAHCGASPQCSGEGKVRGGEGAIGPSRTGGSTRGRVRSPEEAIANDALNTYPRHRPLSQPLNSKYIKYENENHHPNCR